MKEKLLFLELASTKHSQTLRLRLMPAVSGEWEESLFPDTKFSVYNDSRYSISVVDSKNSPRYYTSIFINDDFYSHDEAEKISSSNNYLFSQYIGAVHFSVEVDNKLYYTESVSVLVKEIDPMFAGMIGYIYENSDKYIGITDDENTRRKVRDIAIEQKLRFLDGTISLYERHYLFFKNSAPAALVVTEEICPFEKLKTITPATMQYISTHPEELQQVEYNSGLNIRGTFYQPKHTLSRASTYTSDSYENRVIVGFLELLVNDLATLKNEITRRLDEIGNPKRTENGYTESKYLVFSRAADILNGYLGSIDRYIERLQSVTYLYRRLLNVTETHLTAMPKYTGIFRNVVPYNSLFSKIKEWFETPEFVHINVDFILSYVKNSKIYEYYCLIRILQCLEALGCELKENGREAFRYSESKLYKNEDCYNTFRYITPLGDDLTVYFQPQIYMERGSLYMNDIMLRRNSSNFLSENMGFINVTSTKSNGAYTPDYLIALTRRGVTCYYIVDAKFSTLYTVRRHYIKPLIFKYMVSVTAENGTRLASLTALCGRETEIPEDFDGGAAMIAVNEATKTLTGFDALERFLKGIITKGKS